MWHVAIFLEQSGLASARSPPLLQTRFSLTASLRAANVSLMVLPAGSQLHVPDRYLCCGAYQDFVVPDVLRSLALRVTITVNHGTLTAIYLKHASCARFDTDVSPDETCTGSCELQWLTTYNPFTLETFFAKESTATVPMGIVRADRRQAGDWYISISAPSDGSVNFSILVDLIESPVIDQFIPLDDQATAAERCGRFCVVLPEYSPPPSPPYWRSAATPGPSPMFLALLLPLGVATLLWAER